MWSNSSSFGATLVVSFTLAGFFPFFEVDDFLAFFGGGGEEMCSGFALESVQQSHFKFDELMILSECYIQGDTAGLRPWLGWL